jgi:hypothetical protein
MDPFKIRFHGGPYDGLVLDGPAGENRTIEMTGQLLTDGIVLRRFHSLYERRDPESNEFHYVREIPAA